METTKTHKWIKTLENLTNIEEGEDMELSKLDFQYLVVGWDGKESSSILNQ